MSAQCRRRSVVGGRAAAHKSRPTDLKGLNAPESTIVGNERIATKIGVGNSRVGLATVSSVFWLPQVQSSPSSWLGPHGDGLGSLLSVGAVVRSA